MSISFWQGREGFTKLRLNRRKTKFVSFLFSFYDQEPINGLLLWLSLPKALQYVFLWISALIDPPSVNWLTLNDLLRAAFIIAAMLIFILICKLMTARFLSGTKNLNTKAHFQRDFSKECQSSLVNQQKQDVNKWFFVFVWNPGNIPS